MIVYVSCIIISVIIAMGIQKYKKTNDKTLCNMYKIFAFLPGFLVMGLRYGIGQDYLYTYKPIFDQVLRFRSIY